MLFSKNKILLFFLSIGVFLNFIIPPMQNPDEPQHFGMILTYTHKNPDRAIIDNEVIRILDTHNWWKFLGLGKPFPLPKSFSKIGFFGYASMADRLESRTFYHILAGRILRPIANINTVYLYYICRLLSLLLFIISFYFIFLTLQKIAKNLHNVYACGFLFILFLPQFLILSISVNSDAFIIFLGSIFFYAYISLMMEDYKLGYMMLLFFAAGIGSFADKSSMFMVLLIPFLLFLGKDKKKIARTVLVTLCLVSICLVWITWFFPSYVHNTLLRQKGTLYISFESLLRLSSKGDFNIKFIQLLIDSFFLRFGWMAYSAETVFHVIWRALMGLSVIGLLLYIGRSVFTAIKKKHAELAISIEKKIAVLSVSTILIQVLALWVFYGSKNIYPQGRYLFPLIGPFAFLFILGLKNLGETFSQKSAHLGVALIILFEFFFFNYALWSYFIPVFHLSLQSPYPGI